ncbi:MAG: sugar ABC transporter permease [Chloroflexi bacterium]|nr:MAG: sugar ABC transporter permease [Chloroflexota bacterium]
MIALRRPRMSRLAWHEARSGLLFLSPWIIGFLAFTLIPVIATLAFTFTNITLSQDVPLRFVGLDNYLALFRDPQVWESLLVTFKFAAISLPVAVILPFAVALLLNSRSLRGSALFRVLFFMPYVVPFVAGVLIWSQMLNSDTGWINGFLGLVGIQGPDWLNDAGWVYPGLVIIGVWGIGGGIIVNQAGLKGIPTELYDAARIDGAGWWGQLRHVTLPMMSPVIFYTLVLGVVEVLQYFLVPLVLNQGAGEPGGATRFYNLYLYKTFFAFQEMSYGATLAWLLFLITLAITGVLFWSARYWVYYAGESSSS